jgi:separase
MALGKGETRARLETIKADLRTISTCTDTTVAELQEFLGVRIAGAPQQENTRVQRAQLPTARRRAGTTATTTTDNVKEPESLLTPRERYVLATEAANITLKSLADALKTQPPAQARPTSKAKPASDAKAQKPARPRPPHTKSYSVAHPLKERSVSQVINSPRKPSSLRRSSSYSSFLSPGPDDGLVATAECARIAFAHLGTPEAVKVAGKDTPALQLENGCLALIGKLVAHGLDSLAAKEMRTLKRRLDKHLGRDDEKQATKPTLSRLGSQQLVEKESLATLLDFGELDRKDPALPIITNLQTYALRVIARSKRPRTVEAAWTHLKLSNPSSPANLIYHTAKSAENPAKSARQLESLAQTILLLCPSVSFPDDGDTLQVSPDIVLCLQHLAFRVRQRWWRLAKHQGNTEKELAEPFARCLLAFAKRSQLSPAKKYKLAENLHTDLFGSGQDEDKPQPNLLVSQTLSSFAQAAGLPDEALRYLGSSSSPTTQIPGAREAARLARIATVSLESCLKNGGEVNVDDTVAAILGALAGSLSGSATDLNALFLELHALRRVATRLLSANRQSQQESHFAAIERQCFLIIDASIKFSLRFISERPGVEADPKVLARQQERLAMALKLLKSGVDSVLACCRRPLTDVSEWGELDTLIQNCVRLVLHMEESPNVQDPQTDFQGVQGPLVKFSNGYWAIQLQLRKLNADLSLVATVMQQSVSLLQTRSLVEREAGVLTMKLERLGEILDQLERPKESREAYEQCARNFLSEAACQDIAEMASKHALQRMFEDATSSAALGRVLKAHHRSFAKYGLKRPDEVAFYDDEEHPVPVRGAMLEWQLALYQKTLSRNRQWDADLNLSIQAIGERLLGIYTTAKYPIRRQRVYLSLLQLSLAHPGILSELPACPQVRIDTPSDSGDGGLARFSPHLQALLTLKLCLQSASPSVAEIRQCFITWESIVDTARTWEEIVDQVDNVDYWLQEMQASVDCLSAKGEEYASLPVLRLLTRIFELRGGSDCSELVASLCTSGLQFLRLGYSGKGGLAFAKAEVLLSSKMGSTESRLIWHLGYAEYLLKIGNISKWYVLRGILV